MLIIIIIIIVIIIIIIIIVIIIIITVITTVYKNQIYSTYPMFIFLNKLSEDTASIFTFILAGVITVLSIPYRTVSFI